MPRGRVFEREVFGIVDDPDVVSQKFIIPRRFGFRSSLQNVIQNNWTVFAQALETGALYCHNPLDPKMGKTGLIHSAVKGHLPRRIGGSSMPLNLYVGIGRNSLDWHHGVDAFFWWYGACVTIDVSLVPGAFQVTVKADFVLTPEDLLPQNISNWALNVAALLKKRGTEQKLFNQRKIRKHKDEGDELELDPD